MFYLFLNLDLNQDYNLSQVYVIQSKCGNKVKLSPSSYCDQVIKIFLSFCFNNFLIKLFLGIQKCSINIIVSKVKNNIIKSK